MVPGRAHLLPHLAAAAQRAQDAQWFAAYGAAYVPPEQQQAAAQRAANSSHGSSSSSSSSSSSGSHGSSSSGNGKAAGKAKHVTRAVCRGDHGGMTPLHHAAKVRRRLKPRLALSCVGGGAPCNSHLDSGSAGTQVGEPDAVRALLACGADPLAVCKQRFTALHWLCGATVHQVCAFEG